MKKEFEVPYYRTEILRRAEQGARMTHAGLRHDGMSEEQKQERLEDRILRAERYAHWRIGSYERGETVLPW